MVRKVMNVFISLTIIFVCLTLLNLYSDSFSDFLDSSYFFFKKLFGTLLHFLSES